MILEILFILFIIYFLIRTAFLEDRIDDMEAELRCIEDKRKNILKKWDITI